VSEPPTPPEADRPGLLSSPLSPGPPLSPARELPDLAALHRQWADVHAPTSAITPPPGWMGAVRARAGTLAAQSTGQEQREDRALIGDLIRVAEALAVRCDELGGRVQHLEAALEEAVAVLSEDLVHVRAALEDRPGPAPSVPTGPETGAEPALAGSTA